MDCVGIWVGVWSEEGWIVLGYEKGCGLEKGGLCWYMGRGVVWRRVDCVGIWEGVWSGEGWVVMGYGKGCGLEKGGLCLYIMNN